VRIRRGEAPEQTELPADQQKSGRLRCQILDSTIDKEEISVNTCTSWSFQSEVLIRVASVFTILWVVDWMCDPL